MNIQFVNIFIKNQNPRKWYIYFKWRPLKFIMICMLFRLQFRSTQTFFFCDISDTNRWDDERSGAYKYEYESHSHP